ncbi:glycosyltransferase family protein [Acaryochloris marina]|uniref:AAA family ATPase n=1 Tax=Acaryochloris marina TaxID=155978 RepID=UPI0021C3F817|nr:AAA family ATPase [Acaryochloris marina]BDM78604.1 hypothetical protein AM10699_14730 [Acaryochloris marina MBIC10699]
MVLNVGQLFRACNPSKTLNYGDAKDRACYIDFAAVRGNDVVKELRRTINLSGDDATCQLFTGHIGCGKSTELSRLKQELEDLNYHVVFFESSEELDLADVDISDILLVIARQITQSLAQADICLEPTRFQKILHGAVDLLNSEVTGLKLNIPALDSKVGMSHKDGEYSLAFGIGELTTKSRDSKEVRSLLRSHLEPRVNTILEAINTEIMVPAKTQLQQQGKAGLVVIVDNLDRIDNLEKLPNRSQPEYLFVDRGEQLKQLTCHVIYTIPLVLAFSNEKERLSNRFGSDPQLLPMVRVQNRDQSSCEAGMAALKQMILVRAGQDQLSELFDSEATLERLCQASGGHVRNLLVLMHGCLKKDDPPVSSKLLEQVISQRRYDLSKPITADEWELLRQVRESKAVRGEDAYQTLLRSLFVFEYRDEEQSWFDINPILTDAEELR